MKAVLQRVTKASVEVDGATVGRIDAGLLVLLGVAKGDEERDALYLVDKISTLRIFADEQGKMNRSIADINGAVLLVSQFTLLGETAKGRRPDFTVAAAPEQAKALYEKMAEAFRGKRLTVETGRFGAYMKVELINDGPVTLLLDSRRMVGHEAYTQVRLPKDRQRQWNEPRTPSTIVLFDILESGM